MENENTNPSGEVSDDELVSRLLASQDEGGEQGEQEEPDEPERDEPEQDEEEESPKARKLRIKLDGREEEVDESEVVAGYQRQKDYTKKTQELAEQRKAHEAERQQVQQERAYYANQLQQLAQQFQPQKIDWDALKESDPIAYVDAVRKETERQQKAQQVQAEQARIFHLQQQDEAQRFAQRLAEETERLATLIPEYGDAEKRKAVQSAIRNYAQTIGFTDEELASATDSRAVLVLDKARRYDELMAKAKAVKPAVQPTAKPGAIRPPANKVQKSLERLKRTGSDADAIEYLLNR